MSINKNLVIGVLAAMTFSSTVTYFISKSYFEKETEQLSSSKEKEIQQIKSCNYNIKRLSGFAHIKPLQYAEPACESSKYDGLKGQLELLINTQKQQGKAKSISIYFRDFDKADWMCINCDEKFHPGSLMKLQTLIALLKMEEKTPGLLQKQITFTGLTEALPNQSYNNKQIEEGKSYTVKELLDYMIAYSDNKATYLLNKCLDLDIYTKMYTELGLSSPDVRDANYMITAKDYATFLKVIYNGNYLSPEHSEYVVQLLTKCDFDKGFSHSLPTGTPIAHKFGEYNNAKDVFQLHESGLIYINGAAYLLTVMTDGASGTALPEVLSEVSKNVFDYLNDPSSSNSNYKKSNNL